MGIRNKDDHLDKYGKDRFVNENQISYIFLTEGLSKTTSPVYKIIKVANDRNMKYGFGAVDEAVNGYRNSKISDIEYDIINNLIKFDNGETSKNIFERLWIHLSSYMTEDYMKYQQTMISIGRTVGFDDEYIFETIGYSSDESDEDDESDGE